MTKVLDRDHNNGGDDDNDTIHNDNNFIFFATYSVTEACVYQTVGKIYFMIFMHMTSWLK